MNAPRIFLSLAALLFLVSCSSSDFSRIPRNSYIEHMVKNDKKRMPFDSYWDISDNKDWDDRVTGAHHKRLDVYVAPVSLEYFRNMPKSPRHQAAIRALRDYFDARLATVLGKQAEESPHFRLVKQPTPNAYRVEIALLSAKPANIIDNIASDVAGTLYAGLGFLISRKSDKGSISMGAKYFAPNGKLVAEVADFEYGQSSLVGLILVDFKDFSFYAYQRQTIDQWVDEFAKLFTTKHEQRVHKPWVTFNPF